MNRPRIKKTNYQIVNKESYVDIGTNKNTKQTNKTSENEKQHSIIIS
jgi:hypothetical protein